MLGHLMRLLGRRRVRREPDAPTDEQRRRLDALRMAGGDLSIARDYIRDYDRMIRRAVAIPREPEREQG